MAKSPKILDREASLNLRFDKVESDELKFRRGIMLPVVEVEINRQQLFSICGKLVGHYPVAR